MPAPAPTPTHAPAPAAVSAAPSAPPAGSAGAAARAGGRAPAPALSPAAGGDSACAATGAGSPAAASRDAPIASSSAFPGCGAGAGAGAPGALYPAGFAPVLRGARDAAGGGSGAAGAALLCFSGARDGSRNADDNAPASTPRPGRHLVMPSAHARSLRVRSGIALRPYCRPVDTPGSRQVFLLHQHASCKALLSMHVCLAACA